MTGVQTCALPISGALPEPALVNLVQAVRDVDMDQVRAQLAAGEAPADQ